MGRDGSKSRATKSKSNRAVKREEKRFSFTVRTHNGGYEMTVGLSMAASEKQTKSLLAQMPPDGSIWPAKAREVWLAKLVTSAQLHTFDGVDQRISLAFAEVLAFNDQAGRQHVRTVPKPILKIVGGYESI